MAHSYRDLIVWQRAMELAVECHAATRKFPRRSSSGLVAQIERASGAIPANIAEGNGRQSRPDYLRHLSMANGSLQEVETHILPAARLSLVSPDQLTRMLSLSGEVGRMLAGLMRKLRETDERST
jgi:four helix bundle protein